MGFSIYASRESAGLRTTRPARLRTRIPALVATLEKQVRQAAKRLEFERAAELRDQIRDLKRRMLGIIDQEDSAEGTEEEWFIVSNA